MKAYARQEAPAPHRDRLILEHVDMARRIALRVGRRVPDSVASDDLVAAALVGLTEAAERFDEARGQPFVAFAEKRIRGAVLDELRRGDLMSRRARNQSRKVGQAIRTLATRLGREPEDAEVAAELGVDLAHYVEELEGLTHVTSVPLEGVLADSLAEDGDRADPAQGAARRELTGRLTAALRTLPERDALVLSLYYVEELSYAEIGRILGVTESRVCQLHARSMARLRSTLEEP